MSIPEILQRDQVRLYRAPKGLGDALFMSTVARETKKRRPDVRIVVDTHWPQLFHHNPDVDAVFPAGNRPKDDAIPVVYEDPWPPPRKHVLRIVCERLGLEDPEIRTYYYSTAEERAKARAIRPPSSRPLVVVHPFSGFFAARSKQWDFGHWKRYLELLPPEIETIRFGGPEEPATPTERPNHREMVNMDIRLIAALLESADAFVGQESGLAHLATALGVPSVVLFTGFVPPDVFGYPQNINLVPDVPWAPCWQKDGCAPCRAEVCTRAIKPETVLEKTLEILDRTRARRRWRR
ncbi:MAG: glycosyltransferase family 9 protein [Planctomycetota bacterium]